MAHTVEVEFRHSRTDLAKNVEHYYGAQRTLIRFLRDTLSFVLSLRTRQ